MGPISYSKAKTCSTVRHECKCACAYGDDIPDSDSPTPQKKGQSMYSLIFKEFYT